MATFLMAKISSHFTLVAVFLTLLSCHLNFYNVVAISSRVTNGQSRPFNQIYAFGDSFTDTGNTHSATGPNGFMFVSNPPYGMTYFRHPTNRYSDGRLVIDFVAQALQLPFLPPYHSKSDFSNGVNFAVAGSTAIDHDFFVKNNLTLDITRESLVTQLGWFDDLLATKGCGSSAGALHPNKACDRVFKDAMIWVGEIGVNDYAYILGSTVTPETIQDLSIKSISWFLQALLQKGAKYVVVQGMPPTGCLPLAMSLSPQYDRDELGCVGTVNKQNAKHNAILKAKLHDLRAQFPRSNIIYADYYNVYHTIMKDPTKYGFSEAFKACCGAGGEPYNFEYWAACGSPNANACDMPGTYINWDGVHLTEGMYKVASDMFIRQGFCSPSFDFLLSKKLRRG